MKFSQKFLLLDEPEHSLTDIFEEEPVPLKVFVEDFKYLNNPPLSPVQYDLVQHIERVYLPSLYPLMAKEFGGYWEQEVRMTNLISAMWGKGSGKDSSVRVAALRVAYLLLCLKSPQKYFGLPEQDSIHMLNIATNAPQANRAFFAPMARAVKRGWFADKADAKRDVIEFAKNVEAISGHSEAEGQEGLNLILGVADEIDGFKTKAESGRRGGAQLRESSTSAETILDMLKTSASTRFPESYKRVAISYPRYLGSTIMKLVEESDKDIEEMGDKSIYYASGPKATWEVNPRVKGKEQFANDYRKDPKGSAAKYECKPTRATKPYFQNPEYFRSSVDRPTQPLTIDYELVTKTVRRGGISTDITSWEPKFTFAESFVPKPGAVYALHCDLAIVNDRAGIALSHVEKHEVVERVEVDETGFETTHQYTLPVVKTDFVVSFEASKEVTPAREIQIRWTRELVFQLIHRGFNVGQVSHDGFQSVDTLQILESYGIPTTKRSTDLKPEMWKTLKDIVTDGRLKLPFSNLLLIELEALSDVGGGRVDHPVNGSKDLADALAGSVEGALFLGGQEHTGETGAFFETAPRTTTLNEQGQTLVTLGSDYVDPTWTTLGDLPFGMKEFNYGNF